MAIMQATQDEAARSGGGALPAGRLLDSREVAAYLRVLESTLSRWRASGAGPPFLRLGGIARYRAAAVEGWLAGLEDGRGRG
jgi:predicted DNA-binding transcriptional regulator AlpA